MVEEPDQGAAMKADWYEVRKKKQRRRRIQRTQFSFERNEKGLSLKLGSVHKEAVSLRRIAFQ